MPRLQPLDPSTATGQSIELLDQIQAKMGMKPNILKTMAQSPAALQGYLAFTDALAAGSLSDQLREQIALVVAESNGCTYCLGAHSATAKMQGLSQEAILDSRQGSSPDSKTNAALKFALAIVEKYGWVDDEDLSLVKKVGFTDGEIGEIIANVSLNIFRNYFNHVAETEMDFPVAPELAAA